MRRWLGAAVVVAAALASTACGGSDDAADADADGDVAVTDAWARATPGGVTVGAIYFRATSDAADELTGATVDPGIAAAVEVHSTETSADGTATMEERDALALPADGELVLEPIGNHLMLVGLVEPLTVGETFDVTLRFAVAGEQVVEVEVREDAP